MKIIKTFALILLFGFLALVVVFDLWGALTLGSIKPAEEPVLTEGANAVVMVFGATGTVGDGLLEAAINDLAVKKVYLVARSSSPRIDAGVATGTPPSQTFSLRSTRCCGDWGLLHCRSMMQPTRAFMVMFIPGAKSIAVTPRIFAVTAQHVI